MKRGRENIVVAVFGAIFLLTIILIANQGFRSTGYATEVATTSNVTISVYFAIEMSTNLTQGIQFGTISTLPATNSNATHNYDGYNATEPLGTSFITNVSSDSNTAVDFCLKADTLNTSAGDFIGLGNESYANHSTTNVTVPDVLQEVSFTTAYVSSGRGIAIGGENFYRFWLDVPAGTSVGTYNNTVSFKGVATGGAC